MKAGMGHREHQGAGADRLLVVPAVDVLGDEAVRLERGDYARVTLRAGAPEGLVAAFAEAGARAIHVVDLEGARDGRIRPSLVARLCRAADGVPVQASGGIRSVDDACALIEAGAARVVVGTAAFADPGSLRAFAETLGERLIVAIDVRAGLVQVAGWTKTGGITVEEAARRCAEAGVERLLCTAIERDGTLAGPDLNLLVRVRQAASLPILAAGGIRSPADLARLAEIGMEGAIVGRALLEGTIPLSALG